ncbi:PREDICTED: glucose-6-phosphate 1-dehydrogenase 4, chloroplastic [Tarenaya hassleriana]|uniref:glucose-6-phosphate 1-dehydrogenase 4, chloroplastic n=1 Tax=Tarenaya hassleriana TaxID=28532 RepID=UPI00053CA5F9|nr:PREDICTED: glucose-6-phosphate 1-dehydrogenase 4, chloroplastic [Tarenaya hassleriana]
MSSFSTSLLPFSRSAAVPPPISAAAAVPSSFPVSARDYGSLRNGSLVLYGGGSNICRRFCGLKLWIIKSLNLRQGNRKHQLVNELKTVSKHENDHLKTHSEQELLSEDQIQQRDSLLSPDSAEETTGTALGKEESLQENNRTDGSEKVQKQYLDDFTGAERGASLCIAVIGATGELARRKIFPALFALYYSGYLPEDVGIFGYSRKNLTDKDLRSIIASTLTCRIDHQQNCEDKIDAFLSRTYYINGGHDNKDGMFRLNERMKQIEGGSEANRIFYLSVPQEALMDVACTLSESAQAIKGWTRIIVEKPFGFDARSSHQLTKSLLSKFQEKQIYRIDHMLGRNLIENLTVLRFSNLVFEPLWSRTYLRNVQIIVSESVAQKEMYSDGYGIIRDIVHSHILQTIALLAMEPPISLDGEDIRNEKVKVLRSIRKLDPSDVILGQYKTSSRDKVDVTLNTITPTYCAAALYIDNGRWDGVPFLIRVGTGLIKHRVEIRMQFRHVPGNLYRERLGLNIDLATNELILRDEPDEAILVKVNNKIPGLGLQLDTSELNLLYKDRYNVEVPDSYEHLVLDVIDGDNHLFMRSDEVAAAWSILNPVLEEIDKNNTAPELYEFGGRGPVGAYYLWAKHGVPWGHD